MTTDLRPTDPLAPVNRALRAISVVIGIVALMTATLFLGGGSPSISGFGGQPACVWVSDNLLSPSPLELEYIDPPTDTFGDTRFPTFVGSSYARIDTVEVCADDPSIGVGLMGLVYALTALGMFGGFLILTRRVLKAARRDGFFTLVVARRTRTLGRFLLIGSLTAAAANAAANGVVVGAATTGVVWYQNLFEVSVPWTVLIASAAVLSFSRILERAVPLQDDYDATI